MASPGTELCTFNLYDREENTISKRIETILSCALCHLPYKEPKTLPCGHTFCKRCLGDYVLQQRISNNDMCPAYFPCPTCHKTCPVPAKFANLPSQEILKTLIDTVNSSTSTQECTICGLEGKRSGAAYYCVKCEDFLCDECSKSHKKTRVTRDHLLVRVSSMQYGHKTQSGFAKVLAKYGRHGEDLNFPHSICSNKADDVIVSNDNNDIAVFVSGGSCKKHLNQQPFFGDSAKHPHQPNRGVAFTQEGYLAVALRKKSPGDSQTCVAVIQSLASREIGNCLLKVSDYNSCLPSGLAIMPNNSIVVSDSGLHCIYVFDENYQYVRKFGKRGTGDSKFISPYYVTVNRKNEIIVSDHGNHLLKIYDEKGKFKRKMGGMGSEKGKLLHPMGVCVDSNNNILVADRDNHRVQVFDPSGKYKCSVIKETFERGKDIRPIDISFNQSGNLLVLLKGIEGEDFAEIRSFDYDLDPSRRRRPKHSPSKAPHDSPLSRERRHHKDHGLDDPFPMFDGPQPYKINGKPVLPPVGNQRIYERPLNFEANNKHNDNPSAPLHDIDDYNYYYGEKSQRRKKSPKVKVIEPQASKVCSIM